MRNPVLIKKQPDKDKAVGNNLKKQSYQNEITKLDERLKESEIRYRRLFESAKDGILILDFETGNIPDANPFIIEIIGVPLKELVGKKLWEIGLFCNKQESEHAFTKLKLKSYIRFEDMPIQRPNFCLLLRFSLCNYCFCLCSVGRKNS